MFKYFTYLFYVKEHYSESVQQLKDTIFLQIGKTLPIFTSQKLGLSKVNFFFIRDCKKKEIRCFSFSTVHAFCLLVSYTPRFLRQTLAPFFHFVCGFRFPSY